MLQSLRALWGYRDYRTFLLARVISNLGNGMGPTAVAFGVLSLPGASAASLSAVLATQSAFLVITLPFGGVWADRIGRTRVVGGSDMVLGALILVQAALFLTHRAHVPVLIGFAAVFGVLHAIWYPAFPGIAPVVSPPEHLQSANSVVSAGSNAATIGGAAFAGVIVAGLGPGWAMAIDALTFIVAGALVWSLRHLSIPQQATESTLSSIRRGWREFRANRWVFIIVVAFAFILLAFQGANGVLGPVLMKDHFDGARSWAVVATIESLGFLAGSLVALRVRPKRPMRIAMLAMLGMPVFVVSMAVPMPVWVIAAAAFVCGIGTDVFQVLWITALQKHVPSEALARVSAYDAFGSMLFGPIGTALAGPASLAFGLQPAFFLATAVMTVAIAIALLHPAVWRLSDRM